MSESSTESNDIHKLNLNPIDNSPPPRLYFLSSWLNKFQPNQLECYSVSFGISGLSFLALGICILILIYTTYDHHLTNPIDCTILNITHTHVKLCASHRCRVFNYCIPYICTIVFVRYDYKNISYESKLFPLNLNSSCSYEPSSCVSRSHIQFEQIIFLKTILLNLSKPTQCCLHSLTDQPTICSNSLHSIPYSISIILIIMSLILISIGIITQLHLNNYLKSNSKNEKDFLETILNFHFSNGTIRSSIDKTTTTTVNYDLLTQTISYHNTPSTHDDLLLFDIDKEKEIFQKESLRFNDQDEINRQYHLSDDQISSPSSVSHPHVHFLIK